MILAINGSERGKDGHTGLVLQQLTSEERFSDVEVVTLADHPVESVFPRVAEAAAILLATSVRVGGWGSPLQHFLEALEAQKPWTAVIGKPVGALLMVHSVEGSDSAAKLLWEMSLLGCVVPPCSTVILAEVAKGQEYLDHEVWRVGDLRVVIQNLRQAGKHRHVWTTW